MCFIKKFRAITELRMRQYSFSKFTQSTTLDELIERADCFRFAVSVMASHPQELDWRDYHSGADPESGKRGAPC